jgi:hypothetical protein
VPGPSRSLPSSPRLGRASPCASLAPCWPFATNHVRVDDRRGKAPGEGRGISALLGSLDAAFEGRVDGAASSSSRRPLLLRFFSLSEPPSIALPRAAERTLLGLARSAAVAGPVLPRLRLSPIGERGSTSTSCVLTLSTLPSAARSLPVDLALARRTLPTPSVDPSLPTHAVCQPARRTPATARTSLSPLAAGVIPIADDEARVTDDGSSQPPRDLDLGPGPFPHFSTTRSLRPGQQPADGPDRLRHIFDARVASARPAAAPAA